MPNFENSTTRTLKRSFTKFGQEALGNVMMAFPSLSNALSYKKDSLRIAYYHIVSSKPKEYYFDNKQISPDIFKEHLSFLCKNFELISLSQALEMAEKKEPLIRKLVLTFDDGFREIYEVIAPILKEKEIPATFFLIGNCIDNSDLMWRNKLVVIKNKTKKELSKIIGDATAIFSLNNRHVNEDILDWSFRTWPMNKKEEIVNYLWNAADIGPLEEYLQEHKPYLTVNQIRSLIDEGFEIGSHSMSHPDFSRLTYDQFRDEILSSVELLTTLFEKPISSFSYPFGRKSESTFEQRLVKDGGSEIKTFLGTKNKLENYLNCINWERDNLEFPMNKMLFRLNILPLLRRLS